MGVWSRPMGVWKRSSLVFSTPFCGLARITGYWYQGPEPDVFAFLDRPTAELDPGAGRYVPLLIELAQRSRSGHQFFHPQMLANGGYAPWKWGKTWCAGHGHTGK